VLFTDVVGSTAWRVRLGDRAADVRIAELERASAEVVSSFGGKVVKGLGDGVMASFASAAAALDAAVALQAVARRLAFGGSELGLRVGVSSGDMVRTGDDWLGAAAIEAGRLCADAGGGAVLVADATVRLCRGRLDHELRPLGERLLRGFDVPVDVYELVCAGDGGSSFPAPLATVAESPLIGRRSELLRVGSALEAVAAGASVTLFIVGEPGVGKTRLAAAAAADAKQRSFTVLYGRCEEGLAAPYQPVVEAIRLWLVGCPDVALARLVGEDAAELVCLWPELSSRLPLATVPTIPDPETQRWRLFEAVARLVRTLAAERPLVTVIDDLQWAEPSTLLLLAHLVRRAVPGTAVVATVRRPEGTDDVSALLGDLGSGRSVEALHLQGLEAEDVSELVALHAGAEPPARLSAQLRRHTGGNPFFLAALLTHLDEVACVRSAAGVWVTGAEIDAVGVPDGVRGVISRRLFHLEPTARRALDVAAVCGLAFDEWTVRRVLGSDPDETVDALASALTAGLIREEDTGRFMFVHALVRHAVLDHLSHTQIARWHWRIAEELERDAADRKPRLGEIAHHYASAGAAGDAATIQRTSMAAGVDALQRTAFEEAARHFRTALGALDGMAPDPTRRYEVLASLGHAMNALAEPEAAEPLWVQAADLAHDLRDPERLFGAILGYGYVTRLSEDTEFIRLLDDLLELLDDEDSPLRASALGWRAMPLSQQGLFRPAEADQRMADDAVAMARRTGDEDAIAFTLRSRLRIEAQSPDAWAMVRDAEELTALGGAHGELMRWDHTGESRFLTIALLRVGRRTEAEHQLAIAREEAERNGLRMAAHSNLTLESALATASGRFAEGKRLAAQARRTSGRPIAQIELVYSAQILASRMEQGRLAEVIAALRQLGALENYLRGWQAMLAGALADHGERTEAQATLRRLIDIELGDQPHDYHSAALTMRYLPEVCRQLGDRRSAARLLAPVSAWAGQILVVRSGVSIEGGSDRSIGHLLATLGRLEDADAAYAAASRRERAVGFLPLFARTGYWHARALLERGGRSDRERALALLAEVIEITTALDMALLCRQARRARDHSHPR
jgi:tetratricopeptide (TPR) repeat protein